MKKLLPAIWLLVPAPVWAAAADPADTLLYSGLKTLAALLAVLGIILLLYHFARKSAGLIPGARAGSIKVLEMRSLGPKKSLCLVEVKGETFLLGVGVQEINLISRVGSGSGESFEQALSRSREEKP